MTRKTWLISGVVAAVVVALLVGSVALLAGSDLPRWLASMANPQRGPKSSGPSVAWPTMVALAQQNESNVHKDRVLQGVHAQPPGQWYGVKYPGPITGSLEVSFDYDAPSALFAWVRFEDASPTSTLSTYFDPYSDGQHGDSTYNLAREYESKVRAAVAKVKLSPREALAVTWPDAVKSAAQVGAKMEETQILVQLWCGDPDKPLWWIIYSPTKADTKAEEPGDIFGRFAGTSDSMIYFEVNAQTGQIVRFEVGHNVITAPPSPTPKPR